MRKKEKEARTAIDEGDVVDGPAFMRAKIATLKANARLAKPSRKQKKSS